MKKLTSFITAAVMLSSMTACSSKKEPEAKSFTAQKLSSELYKKKSENIPSGVGVCYDMKPYNDGKSFMGIALYGSDAAFWSCSSRFEDFEKLDISDFDRTVSYDYDVLNDGTVVEFIVDADYGGLPEPDIYAEDYHESDYADIVTYSFRIKTYENGKGLVSDVEVGEFPEEAGKYVNMQGVYSDGESVIVSINSKFYDFSADGTYIGELEAESGESISAVGKNSEGKLICAVSMPDDKMQLREINSGGTIAESAVTYEMPETVTGDVISGLGGYSAFVTSRTTIYGITDESLEIKPLFSFSSSGLFINDISCFIIDDDGSFIFLLQDSSSFSTKRCTYRKCTQEELDSIKVVTLGIKKDGSTITAEYVDTFNESQDEFILQLREYEDGEELKNALMSGDIPDMFMIESLSGEVCGINLLDNGVLCTIDEAMAAGSVITRDDLIPELAEKLDNYFDGKACLFPTRLCLWLDYTVKEKFIKDIGEWSIDTLLDVLENMPEGMGIMGDPELSDGDFKGSRYMLLGYEPWIDYDKNTCSFDSESFIRYLKYCGNGEDFPENGIYHPELTEEERNKNTTKHDRQFRDDKALFLIGTGSTSYENFMNVYLGFGSEPVVTFGTPTLSGSSIELDMGDCFGITKKSENKELAMRFVKYMCDMDYALGDPRVWRGGFSITKKGREKGISESRLRELREYLGYDENGKYQMNNLGYLTDEQIAFVDDMMNRAQLKKGRKISIDDREKMYAEIIHDEIEGYFAGDISAEMCAKHLQDRVSVFLSERE